VAGGEVAVAVDDEVDLLPVAGCRKREVLLGPARIRGSSLDKGRHHQDPKTSATQRRRSMQAPLIEDVRCRAWVRNRTGFPWVLGADHAVQWSKATTPACSVSCDACVPARNAECPGPRPPSVLLLGLTDEGVREPAWRRRPRHAPGGSPA